MLSEKEFGVALNLIKIQLEKDYSLDLNELVENLNKFTGFKIDDSDRKKLISYINEDKDFKEVIDRVIITDPTIIRDKRKHTPWYGEWLEKNQKNSDSRYNWTQINKLLKTKLSKNYKSEKVASIIKSIDTATDNILGDMENPQRPTFNSKGLVLGYVQSGKTANFTALISKAVDAGYRFIVVLTGLHENLRRQTQVRLDQELTGENETDQDSLDYVTIPPIMRRWIRLTSAPKISGNRKSEGEFKKAGKSSFSYELSENNTKPLLAVIKKNQAPMQDLIDWINETIDEKLKNSVPFLLIDDEADLASINTRSRNFEISPTNERIRILTQIFTKSSYVAYTATPFANFFIDINTPEDLYPRNFIYSLPEPEGYFGSSRIFDSPINMNYLKIINRGGREIPSTQDDVDQLLGKGEYSTPEIPETLIDAIFCFILSCSIRCLRGDENKAMSMLIHIDWKKTEQGTIFNIVNDYFNQISHEIKSPNYVDHIRKKLLNNYKDFTGDSKQILKYLRKKGIMLSTNILPSFDKIFEKTKDLLNSQNEENRIKILLLNSNSEDELDYTGKIKPKVIAIGGNKLSRGLTIDGLMTSYYARNSQQYDTLLQMGRWFGYRQGYEDLTRVWSTAQIHTNYQHLSLVEEEIRTNLSIYEEDGVSPVDIPILVRDHMNLNVTARNKLGSAGRAKSSFSGQKSQTFKLPLNDIELLKENITLTDNFIQSINDKYGFSKMNSQNYVSLGVDANELIENYLNLFQPYDCGFPYNDLKSYIQRRVADNEYLTWNIGVKSLKNKKNGNIQWGGLDINMIARTKKYSKLQSGEHHIGVLTEPEDKNMDLNEIKDRKSERPSDANPLLVLYRIAATSSSKKNTNQENGKEPARVGLWEKVKGERIHPMGIALFTPISVNEPNSFIGQVLI